MSCGRKLSGINTLKKDGTRYKPWTKANEKEDSEFKPALLLLNTDLVLHFVRVGKVG